MNKLFIVLGLLGLLVGGLFIVNVNEEESKLNFTDSFTLFANSISPLETERFQTPEDFVRPTPIGVNNKGERI